MKPVQITSAMLGSLLLLVIVSALTGVAATIGAGITPVLRFVNTVLAVLVAGGLLLFVMDAVRDTFTRST